MRSAVYSLFTTLLLLVPISAVPLMAIFGIPQFTPVVASPLDEPTDEAWGSSNRRKPRPAAKKPRTDDAETDLTLEETPNWDDDVTERPRPIRKAKSTSATTAGGDFPGDDDTDLAATKRSLPKNRRSVEPIEVAEDAPIQKAGHQSVKDRDSDEENAGEIEDLLSHQPSTTDEELPAVPSYRRPRTSPKHKADSSSDKNSARNKRTAPQPEPLTWTKAVRRLNDLGIRNFRLEPGERPGEFLFACSYTPSQTPHVTRRFEAEADDPLKAVSKVLAQVEEAVQQRALAAPRRMADSADRSDRE